ncbi:MAG: ERCC4 domain-containing protein, partial [Candidatus Heimdallarchaeota archaeon]
ECNLVIFYDSTASAIRKIQRIGRTGRKQKGKVIVLTTHHTIDTALHYVSNSRERKMNSLLANIDWLNRELAKEKPKDTRAFAPETHEVVESMEPTEPEEEIEVVEEADINLETNEKLSSFKIAIKDVEKWTDEAPVESKDEETKKEKTKDDAVKIIVDSREKNSKILFYLKKQGIDLEFKQLDCADYVVSDRTAIEYKKGEDLLSSIIDGRLFEQLGSICNAYQIPILLIEGFPSGGIHPEAIAGALSSFMIDFGVSIIQTQSSEESAVILKRLAIREQKTKKRKALIRKAFKISNPRENALSVLSSFPGINRVLATRMLEKLKSVKGVINASKEDLNEIEGMGVKKSKKFTELAGETYD